MEPMTFPLSTMFRHQVSGIPSSTQFDASLQRAVFLFIRNRPSLAGSKRDGEPSGVFIHNQSLVAMSSVRIPFMEALAAAIFSLRESVFHFFRRTNICCVDSEQNMTPNSPLLPFLAESSRCQARQHIFAKLRTSS